MALEIDVRMGRLLRGDAAPDLWSAQLLGLPRCQSTTFGCRKAATLGIGCAVWLRAAIPRWRKLLAVSRSAREVQVEARQGLEHGEEVAAATANNEPTGNPA